MKRTATSLTALRRAGLRILVATAWGCTLAQAAIGLERHNPDTGWAVLLSIAANIAPTLAARRRTDYLARLTMGTLAAIHPAIAIFLWRGNPLQLDVHLYFMVALAALMPLCDWRPIALAAMLTLLHHVAADLMAPDWAFFGGSTAGRVAIHAGAVALETAVLGWVAERLRALLNEQDAVTAEAEARRRETEQALDALRAAEQAAEAERHAREAAEASARAARGRDLLAIANQFRASVSDVAGEVGAASTELEGLARALDGAAARASRETGGTLATATQASSAAADLAHRIAELTGSVAAISAAADRQASLADAARCSSASGQAAVRALTDQTASIGGFAESVGDIAQRTNLLALNATIEAARAGDVGRGFTVVAQEVKSLAGQTAGATGEIRTLTAAMAGGAGVADQALGAIATVVVDLADAAAAIRRSVDTQHDTAHALAQAARETASGADHIAARLAGVATAAEDAAVMSGQVAGAAAALAATARRLTEAGERFVAALRAA